MDFDITYRTDHAVTTALRLEFIPSMYIPTFVAFKTTHDHKQLGAKHEYNVTTTAMSEDNLDESRVQ